jgi:Killing trait
MGADNDTPPTPPPTVNPTILDAVKQTSLSVIGQARAESQAVTYESLAHSLALVMHNAGSTQFAAKQVETVMVAMACQRIMAAAK